jgi:flagellar motor switch protein FliM
MPEVLTQKEIDQLLTAINDGGTEEEDFSPKTNTRKIKIYDFKRPDKFKREQINAISLISKSFAYLAERSFSSKLDAPVKLEVASVDQLTYEESIRSLPTPTTLAIIDMHPLKGKIFLELDPAMTNVILNKIFGGKGEIAKGRNALTELEKYAIQYLIHPDITGALQKAWAYIIELSPQIEQIETNPQFCQITKPDELVALITFEYKLFNTAGLINLCIPFSTIETIMNKLSAKFWHEGKLPEKKETTMENLGKVNIPVIVELGRGNFPLKELEGLREGSILELDRLAGEAIDVYANNVHIAKGEVVVVEENFAIRIMEVIHE